MSSIQELRKTHDEFTVHIIDGVFGVVTQVMHGPPSFLIARLYARILSEQIPLWVVLGRSLKRFSN